MKNIIYLSIILIVLDLLGMHDYFITLVQQYRYGLLVFPILLVVYHYYIEFINAGSICIKSSEDNEYVLNQIGQLAQERGARVQKEFK